VKFAHVLIPEFAIQVEILENPRLRRKAVVIGGRSDDEGEVVACSPLARRAGVLIGMSLRQAQQLSPSARFLPPDETRYQAAHRSLIRCLEAFSPLRETVQLGEICIEASGLEGLYGPDRQMVEQLCEEIRDSTNLIPKVGLASNRFTASVAAGLAELSTARMVPRGSEMEFLAPMGIPALVPSEEAQQLLTRLGVVTLGQVASLPAGALSRTLGREGERLHRLARGIDRRPLVPEFEEAPLSARVTLDWQLEFLPALVAYAEVLAGQLSSELETAGLAAGNVIVEVEQEGGELLTAWGYLRPASADRSKLLNRAAGLLEDLDYSAGAIGLKVSLTPLQPQHLGDRQMPLGSGNALTPDPLGQTLRTIRVRFGDGSIRDAAAVPGPPPEPVEVRVHADGAPSAVYRNRSWNRIDTVQLHWRLEGDWWWQAPGIEGLGPDREPAGAAPASGSGDMWPPHADNAQVLREHSDPPEWDPGAASAQIPSGSVARERAGDRHPGPDGSFEPSIASPLRIAKNGSAMVGPGEGARKDYFQVVTRSGEILVLLRTGHDERWYLHPAAKPSEWPAV
jgi:DNA polymerase-4